MPFGNTPILDNFNRGDEEPITNWTDMVNGLRIVSNEAVGDTNNQYGLAAYDVATYGGDCEVYVTMTTAPIANSGGGVVGRVTTLVAGTWDGYMFWWNGNGDFLEIYRVDDGAFTQLGADTAFTLEDGDKFGGELIGSTLKLYVDEGGGWSEEVSRTDGTYGSAGYLGLRIYDDNVPRDDFGGGSLVRMPFISPIRHPSRNLLLRL